MASTIRSIASAAPMPEPAAPNSTGTMSPAAIPCLSPWAISASVSSSPSRYFIMRSSSASAIVSISFSRSSSYASRSSSVTPLPSPSRLTTPEKLASAPSGSWTARHLRPNTSVMAARVLS